ncbi:MAG: 4Fe-4S binding protein [Deltaproteobacteria bacterium]|nr:4Fe-4S binding protein [Deltaproteobacteria bacterium]
MKINNKCTGCGDCIIYCPQNAISINVNKAAINRDVCVECGVCLDINICEFFAIEEEYDEIARIKRLFGRLVEYMPGEKDQDNAGRRGGHYEVKTNDVTDTLPDDEVIVRLELNRPFGGLKISELENFREYLNKKWDVRISKRHQELLCNNLTPQILGTNILTAMLEISTIPEKAPELTREIANYIAKNTLRCSISLAGSYKIYDRLYNILQNDGLFINKNVKFNLGFGLS